MRFIYTVVNCMLIAVLYEQISTPMNSPLLLMGAKTRSDYVII